MTTELAAAAERLHSALVAGTDGLLSSWRVHDIAPPLPTSPCAYIDDVEVGREFIDGGNGASFVAATFPVVIVVDGSVRAQVEALRDLISYVWDAAATVGEPLDSRRQSLDVGGSSLRAHAVRVQMLITARTLCPSTLATVGGAHA